MSPTMTAAPPESYSLPEKGGLQARMCLAGVARRTLGISLLLVTVFLWTASNFLASVGPLPMTPNEAGRR